MTAGDASKCGALGRLEVDHILPVRTHPELAFDLANLQTFARLSLAQDPRRSAASLRSIDPATRRVARLNSKGNITMLESVKISRRQSEIRQALAGLVGKDKPTEDETRSMEIWTRNIAATRRDTVPRSSPKITERRDAKGELETRSRQRIRRPDRQIRASPGRSFVGRRPRRLTAPPPKSCRSFAARAAIAACRFRGRRSKSAPARRSPAARLTRSAPCRSSIAFSPTGVAVRMGAQHDQYRRRRASNGRSSRRALPPDGPTARRRASPGRPRLPPPTSRSRRIKLSASP